MSSELIALEVSDYVAVVTLNRPPVNALNQALRHAIIETFDAITDRPDVRAAVLTGQGDVFCAGADLKDRPSAEEPGAFGYHNRLTRETTNCIRECAKPVICAVNGPALGAGFGLMQACDIMLASENATFGMPEINVGLAGGAAMLTQLFGRSKTRMLMFTGQRMPAEELYRRGIIEACTTREALLPEAMKIAAEIASKSPTGVRYAKTSCNLVELMPQRDGYRFEQDFTVALSRTENAREARAAFLEKREPSFVDE